MSEELRENQAIISYLVDKIEKQEDFYLRHIDLRESLKDSTGEKPSKCYVKLRFSISDNLARLSDLLDLYVELLDAVDKVLPRKST